MSLGPQQRTSGHLTRCNRLHATKWWPVYTTTTSTTTIITITTTTATTIIIIIATIVTITNAIAAGTDYAFAILAKPDAFIGTGDLRTQGR